MTDLPVTVLGCIISALEIPNADDIASIGLSTTLQETIGVFENVATTFGDEPVSDISKQHIQLAYKNGFSTKAIFETIHPYGCQSYDEAESILKGRMDTYNHILRAEMERYETYEEIIRTDLRRGSLQEECYDKKLVDIAAFDRFELLRILDCVKLSNEQISLVVRMMSTCVECIKLQKEKETYIGVYDHLQKPINMSKMCTILNSTTLINNHLLRLIQPLVADQLDLIRRCSEEEYSSTPVAHREICAIIRFCLRMIPTYLHRKNPLSNEALKPYLKYAFNKPDSEYKPGFLPWSEIATEDEHPFLPIRKIPKYLRPVWGG